MIRDDYPLTKQNRVCFFLSNNVLSVSSPLFQPQSWDKRCFDSPVAMFVLGFSFFSGGSDADLWLNRPGICGIPTLTVLTIVAKTSSVGFS